MEPQNIRFGGGATETILSPVVAVAMVITILVIMVSPRNKVIYAFLLACFNIPVGQVVVLGGVHFTVLRLLIIAALIRRATLPQSSTSKFPGGYNGIDRMVVLWTVSGTIVSIIQWGEMQAFIHALGDFLDALGGYMVVRSFIPDLDAIRRTLKALALVCLIQGAFMINEQISHVNVFGYLGGEAIWVTIRDGKIRSQGVMGCILAGAFAGFLIPLFIWLWKQPKSRLAAGLGIAGAIAMVFTSNASTSILALAAGLLGLAFWPLRKQMTHIRRGFACLLVALHLVMKAPVWALIARVDLTGSSSGYHRYMLVDNCIRHFSDWWLIGYRYYADWGWDMWDTCNQFVDVALKGGLVTLVAYIAIISRSFGTIGKSRKMVEGDRKREWLLWCLGSTLFSTVVASFGINFMAQGLLGIFPLVAFTCVLALDAREWAKRPIEGTEEIFQGQLVVAPALSGAHPFWDTPGTFVGPKAGK